ncbi:T9SS type A sorting domain-containing protein [Dyadobacter sediminis]|uniref:T9SS type A sorting domain-containing protein n=1 Tax=Dyadobacter sediminis TaxID=1493691 RepID=UPI0035B5C5FF
MTLADAISVYPNPATDKLHIVSESMNRIKSIQLLSNEGKSVYQSTTSVKQVDVIM